MEAYSDQEYLILDNESHPIRVALIVFNLFFVSKLFDSLFLGQATN